MMNCCVDDRTCDNGSGYIVMGAKGEEGCADRDSSLRQCGVIRDTGSQTSLRSWSWTQESILSLWTRKGQLVEAVSGEQTLGGQDKARVDVSRGAPEPNVDGGTASLTVEIKQEVSRTGLTKNAGTNSAPARSETNGLLLLCCCDISDSWG